MLPVEASAWLFAIAALATAGLHMLLVLGLPVGFMTMGGRHPGVLPPSARLASLVQGILILCFAWIVLQAAGIVSTPFGPVRNWLLWLIVAVTALSLIANTMTPSRRERWFGMPVAFALFIGSLGVALGG